VNLERTAHSRPIPDGLVIGGYLQAQYEHNQLSEDQIQTGAGPVNQNQFVLRRGRLRVDRGWDFASATLELDANTVNGMSVGVRRAEGALFYRGSNPVSLPPLVMLSAGVTDIPFGYEVAESARMRVFMERSPASLAFYPTEMDTGVKISGAVAFLRYAVSATNGEPVTNRGFPRDPNDNKEITGRFGAVVPIGEAIETTFGASFAEGKGFHPGREETKGELQWRDLDQNGVVTTTEVTATPSRAAEPSKNFERWILGLDFGASLETKLGVTRLYGEAYVASNHDRGFLAVDPVSAGVDVREIGGYVALVQDVTEYGVAGLRVSLFNPNADETDARRGKIEPFEQTIRVVSPVVGFKLPKRARLLFQYDFVEDFLARDSIGVPTDAENDAWTARLQVDL
jgi:hypothetical protein